MPLFCRLWWTKKSKQAPLARREGRKGPVRSPVHSSGLSTSRAASKAFYEPVTIGPSGGGAAEPRGTEPRILLGLVQWFLTMTAADSLAGLPSEMPLASGEW